MKSKKVNIYKAGSKNYYIDALELICDIAGNYDGYDPNNARHMKDLVNDLTEIAKKALKKEKLYCKLIE